jgi:hypothetical protein
MHDSNQNAQLSEQQQTAVRALLLESTIRRAAVTVGVDERTVYRWLHEPAFKQALDEAREEAFQGVQCELRGAAALAAKTLREVMGDAGASPSARVGAALTVLRATGTSLTSPPSQNPSQGA